MRAGMDDNSAMVSRGHRIGINALYLIPGGVGGTETYLTYLLHALAATSEWEYVFYGTREAVAALRLPDNVIPRICNVHVRFRPLRILYEQFILPLQCRRDGIDVLFNPGFTGPLISGCPQVTVFHDLQHSKHPEFFRWFDLPFWKLLLYLSARRSEVLIAVSKATADDLEAHYPFTRGKVRVVPHGVDPEFERIRGRRGARGACDPFLLAVSTLHPHKNYERLLQAFLEFRQTHPRHRLVIVGLRGFAADALLQRRAALGLDGAVEFTGWVEREELYRLYETADAFVAPSVFEGFGMSLVEALAAGVPTACSAIAAHLETSGAACLHFDPESVPEMAAALARIVDDEALRTVAAVQGPAQVAAFTWLHAARRTEAAFEAVVSARLQPPFDGA